MNKTFQKDELVILTEPLEIIWSGKKALLKKGTCGRIVDEISETQVIVSFGNTFGEYKISKDILK